MSEEFYKNWDASKSQNNNGAVPFYRPIELTEEEKAQARKNIGVTGSPDITNLENKVDELEGDVASLRGTVGTVSSQFNTLSGNVDEALTSANAALAGVGAFSADLYTVSGKADTNSGNINALSAQVVTNTTNIASISGKNISQDNKIGELSSSVAGLTNSAVYHEAVINNLTTAWTAYSADLKNDFDTFSAAEDAVITAATAAIPGQVSAEVSGQLSGKQDKLTSANAGQNISISNAGVIDVNNQDCSANNRTDVAIGYKNIASGSWTFAHGLQTSAMNTYSHTEGYATYALNGSHAEGQGTSGTGNQSHSEGFSTWAAAAQSHSEGYRTTASGIFSHAEGRSTLASNMQAHAEGYETSAIGNGSHSEGENTIAIGNRSHAEGYNTSTIGNYSHAEGYGTSALGNYSHSEGYNTQTSGERSHAEGNNNKALGQASHAEGNANIANGDNSHVEGGACVANGQYSHVEGYYNISDGNRNQHVEGQYNAPATGALHVIGNGTSTANRSNIVETYTSGVNVNGNLNVMSANVRETLDGLCDVAYDVISGTKVQFDRYDFSWSNAMSADGKKIGNIYAGRTYSTDGNRYLRPSGVDGSKIGIVKWDGICNRILAYNSVSSFPDTLPSQITNFAYFAVGNTNITSIPSAWNSSIINASIGLNMFGECSNLSGDYTSLMDDICKRKGTTSCPASHTKMFLNCTAVTNYSALTADPKYSGFFV